MISDVIKLKLKEVLKEKDKTLLAVSEETGVSYSTLHKIKENKVTGITFDVLEKLCKNLDCQPADLIELQP